MERKILFRGKATNRDIGYHRTGYKNGDWVYGLVTRLYDENFENLPAEMTNTAGVSGIEVDYKTIGQYTGLTDKNGVKIFEGDIIENQSYNFAVYWDNEYAGFYPIYDQEHPAGFGVQARYSEVVGNIYDDPEMQFMYK